MEVQADLVQKHSSSVLLEFFSAVLCIPPRPLRWNSHKRRDTLRTAEITSQTKTRPHYRAYIKILNSLLSFRETHHEEKDNEFPET
jgi:hypothetical protein